MDEVEMKIRLTHIMEDGTTGGVEFEVPDTSMESFVEATKQCQSGLAVIFNEQDRKDGKQ
jgi:hypothetical protein